MAKGNLDKRVSTLEQQAGHGLPELKVIYMDNDNYLEKQVEIEQAKREGFQVMPIVIIGVNDESECPDYFRYCQSNHKERKP